MRASPTVTEEDAEAALSQRIHVSSLLALADRKNASGGRGTGKGGSGRRRGRRRGGGAMAPFLCPLAVRLCIRLERKGRGEVKYVGCRFSNGRYACRICR
jgi:hypothetical protein